MRLSQYLFKIHKNESGLDAGTDRLLRGCFIQKECAGIFRFTNLGFRVVEKIKHIIRQKLNAIGCLEVFLPILQDMSLWAKSGRSEGYGRESFILQDRKDSKMILAPTAEESATELIIDAVSSYKSLPLTIYQMVEKYRDEMRPRFGLVRSRQFTMKDAYSFSKNEEQAKDIYVDFYNCYLDIFRELEIEVFVVPSDTGDIGGKFTHEFVVINEEVGECPLFYDELSNEKIQNITEIDRLRCGFNKGEFIHEKKCLELGQIYYLGTRYSEPMKATFTDQDGVLKNFVMGCYGIGVTRILSFLAASKKFFPEQIAPFDIHLVGIHNDKSEEVYRLLRHSVDVLYDDRDQKAGTKFSDADLIGIPQRLTVGNTIEWQNFSTKETKIFDTASELVSFLKNRS